MLTDIRRKLNLITIELQEEGRLTKFDCPTKLKIKERGKI